MINCEEAPFLTAVEVPVLFLLHRSQRGSHIVRHLPIHCSISSVDVIDAYLIYFQTLFHPRSYKQVLLNVRRWLLLFEILLQGRIASVEVKIKHCRGGEFAGESVLGRLRCCRRSFLSDRLVLNNLSIEHFPCRFITALG